MAPGNSIPLSHFKIVQEIYENPNQSMTELQRKVNINYVSLNKYLSDSLGSPFLKSIIDKHDGKDGRTVELSIKEGKQEKAELIIELFNYYKDVTGKEEGLCVKDSDGNNSKKNKHED